MKLAYKEKETYKLEGRRQNLLNVNWCIIRELFNISEILK